MTLSHPPNDHLAEAVQVVRVQSKLMRQCLDTHRLLDALKHASLCLSQLRTNALSPRPYYELYMTVFDNMRYLTSYLVEAHATGEHDLGDLYHLVQYASHILPRLYLMVTVGTVYLSVPEAPAYHELLMDMMEMTKGVQHPVRGLFLRHYLGGMTRDFMPQEQLEDIIQFYLANFAEMNKLWVRMQHVGHSRDRAKRDAERKELGTLVGTNLVRISQLEIDLNVYETLILPGIMNEMIHCHDVLAQTYLMDAVIQIFPDEFHLHTLKPLLATIAQLEPQVQIRPLIGSLLDRLASFSIQQQEIWFGLIWQETVELIKTRCTVMAIQDQTALFVSLAQFSVRCYPDQLDHLDAIFLFASHHNQANDQIYYSKQSDTNLLELLLLPIQTWDALLVITTLKHFQPLLAMQPYSTRRTVALAILESVLAHSRQIDQPEQVYQLLEITHVLSPLPKSQFHYSLRAKPLEEQQQQEEERDADGWVARLIHLFYSPDNDLQFLLLSAARQQLEQTVNSAKVRTVFPSLIISSLRLARRYAQDTTQVEYHKKMTTLYTFIHQLIILLSQHSTGQDAISVQLALMAGQNADACDFDEMALQFYLDAFRVYQESVSHSRAQFKAIVQAIGSLLTTSDRFQQHHLAPLGHRLTLFCTKLLKKPDQSRAVLLSSHLWQQGHVVECIEKAITIADHCMDSATNQILLLEALNQSLYHFQLDPDMTVDLIHRLMAAIVSHQHQISEPISSFSDSSSLIEPDNLKEYIKQQWEQTISYIQSCQAHSSAYLAIQCPDMQ